jgi:hypothetical protein
MQENNKKRHIIERNEKSFFLLSSSSIIFICFQFLPFCFVGPSTSFSVLNSIRICCFFHSFSRTHPVCMRVSVCGLSSYNPPNFPFKLYLLFYNETCHCLFNNSFSVQDARELCLTLILKKCSNFKNFALNILVELRKLATLHVQRNNNINGCRYPAQTVIQE